MSTTQQAKPEPVTLRKVADALSQNTHDQAFNDLFGQIKEYPAHEKQAILRGVEMVKDAEASGELPAQTSYGRLNLAHEMVKAAAIKGDETFQKEAQNAYAAGQLAAKLLEEHVAKVEAAKTAAAAGTK